MSKTTHIMRDRAPGQRTEQSRPWRRLHASTYVVLFLTTTVLFLLNVPGERTITFDGIPKPPLIGLTMMRDRIEHGWPCTYLVRDERVGDIDPVTGERQLTSLWSFRQDFMSLSLWRLVANFAITIVVVLVVALIFDRWRRRRRRIWQLTMVDLLALTAIVAVTTAYGINATRVHEEECDALRAIGMVVEDDDGAFAASVKQALLLTSCRYEHSGPHWLRDSVGDWWPEWFDRIVYVEIQDDDLGQVARLRNLRALSVYDLQPDDDHLPVLGKLQHLEALSLDVRSPPGISELFRPRQSTVPHPYDDHTVAKMLADVAKLKRLGVLSVHAEGFGEESARIVSELPRLRTLVLQLCDDLTDDGLATLSQCRSLEVLDCLTIRVTDAGIRNLRELPRLRALKLGESFLGDGTIDALKALPALEEFQGICNQMTPHAIERFAELPKIRRLRVDFKAGPDEFAAVDRLKAARPEVEIEDSYFDWEVRK